MLGNSADCWQCTLLSISVSAAQLAQSHRPLRIPLPLLPSQPLPFIWALAARNRTASHAFLMSFSQCNLPAKWNFCESFSVWGCCLELPVTDINKTVGQTKSGKTAKTFSNPKWKPFDSAGFASLPSLPLCLLLCQLSYYYFRVAANWIPLAICLFLIRLSDLS